MVLDEDTAPPPTKKGHNPQFLAHVCCGQTAGWINMPLGREVGLGPGDIVLNDDPAQLPPKGCTALPTFRPVSIVAKRLMDEVATWYGGRPQPRPHCLMGTQLPPKGAQQPPTFRPLYVVAKRLGASA